MLNKEIPKEKLKRIKLVVLDSDGVSVPRGTFISEKENLRFYEAHIKSFRITDRMTKMVNELKKKIKICFSSGRSLIYLQNMYGGVLGGGTVIQAENGNLSLIDGKIIQHFDYDENYFKKLALIKNEIKKIPISGFEPKQFILTVHSPKEFLEVYKIIKKHDPEEELKCMWNGEAFDVQKKIISKGEGLKKLLDFLKIQKEEVIAIGDRINDKELLEAVGIGVSADIKSLKAEYWIKKRELGGKVLVQYLLDNLK